jgi:hypothetical protein
MHLHKFKPEFIANIDARMRDQAANKGDSAVLHLLGTELSQTDLFAAERYDDNQRYLGDWQAIWINNDFYTCSTTSFHPIRHGAVMQIALAFLGEIAGPPALSNAVYDWVDGSLKHSVMSAWISIHRDESNEWRLGVRVHNAYHTRRKPTLEVYYQWNGEVRVIVPDIGATLGITRSGQGSIRPNEFGFSDREAIAAFYESLKNLPKLIIGARAFQSTLEDVSTIGVPAKHALAFVVAALGLKPTVKFKGKREQVDEDDDFFAESAPALQEPSARKRGGPTAAAVVVQVIREELSKQPSALVPALFEVATTIASQLEAVVSGLDIGARASALGQLVSALAEHLKTQRDQGRSGADWDTFLATTTKSWRLS